MMGTKYCPACSEEEGFEACTWPDYIRGVSIDGREMPTNDCSFCPWCGTELEDAEVQVFHVGNLMGRKIVLVEDNGELEKGQEVEVTPIHQGTSAGPAGGKEEGVASDDIEEIEEAQESTSVEEVAVDVSEPEPVTEGSVDGDEVVDVGKDAGEIRIEIPEQFIHSVAERRVILGFEDEAAAERFINLILERFD